MKRSPIKYISKKKIKKKWKPMSTLPINKSVWLAMDRIHPDGTRPSVIGRTCSSWTGNGIDVGGRRYKTKDFLAWTELKEPIEYKP